MRIINLLLCCIFNTIGTMMMLSFNMSTIILPVRGFLAAKTTTRTLFASGVKSWTNDGGDNVVQLFSRSISSQRRHRVNEREDVSLRMGRRRRQIDGDGDAKRKKQPPVVMQTPDGGVPEVARIYPDRYEELLAVKVERLEGMIRQVIVDTPECHVDYLDNQDEPQSIDALNFLPPTEVFESPKEGFRMRANFKVWRTGDAETGYGTHYVMFEKGDSRTPCEVKSYPMGSQRLQNLMNPVLDAIQNNQELREKINDIRFLTTLAGDSLITITYNRPIGSPWCDAVETLADRLREIDSINDVNGERVGSIKFVGRSRKVKLMVGGDDTVEEILLVPGIDHPLRYRQTEGAFSQPNAIVCQKMLGWAHDATRRLDNSGRGKGNDHDLCELYCGNGCFTVALASNFRRVVATEMSKASVALAQHNLETNQIINTKVARLNAEDFVKAYEGRRSFRRLDDAGIRIVGDGERKQEQHQDTDSDNSDRENSNDVNNDDGFMKFDRLHTLFVDPPRAGLDETCCQLASKFNQVVYVSCNPETLARDLSELLSTHKLTRLAAFDQFPYTPHLEAGVVLERR